MNCSMSLHLDRHLENDLDRYLENDLDRYLERADRYSNVGLSDSA